MLEAAPVVKTSRNGCYTGSRDETEIRGFYPDINGRTRKQNYYGQIMKGNFSDYMHEQSARSVVLKIHSSHKIFIDTKHQIQAIHIHFSPLLIIIYTVLGCD